MFKKSFLVLLLVVVGLASFAEDRQGVTLPSKGIRKGPVPPAVVAALVDPDAQVYVKEITFEGVDVQLGVFSQSLQHYPVSGSTYVAISTGVVTDIPGNASTFISTAVGGLFIPGGSPDGIDAFDVAKLRVKLDLTKLSNTKKPRLKFYFKFMSEEVPSWIGSKYQDFFGVFVYDGAGNLVGNIARLPDGRPFTIDNAWPLMNHVGGTSQNPLPPYPSPNDVCFNGCTDIRPVVFDLSGLVGQIITVEFVIGDAGDDIYDSAVFLDGLSIITEEAQVSNYIKVGPLTIYANNIQKVGIGRFILSGDVNINGVLELEAEVEVNTNTKAVTGTGRVKFKTPKVAKYISETETEFYIDASVNPPVFRLSAGFQELGFKLAGISLVGKDFKIVISDPDYGFCLQGDVGLKISRMGGEGPQGAIEAKGLYISSLRGIGFREASIEVENVKLPGGFKLESLKLVYKPENDTFDFDATLCVPFWSCCIDGGITIVNGALDRISLGVEFDEGVPIIPLPSPPSAIYLQRIWGQLGALTTDKPTISAELGLTYMPEIDINGITLHLLRLDISGTIGYGFFEATGSITVFCEGGQLASATVTWEQTEGIKFEGELDLFEILTGMLKASVNKEGKLRAYGKLSAQIPKDVPLVGGMKFADAEFGWLDWTFGFRVTISVGAGFLKWEIPVSLALAPDPGSPYCQSCTFSLLIPFTSVRLYALCNLDLLFDEVKTPKELITKAVYERTFYVPGDVPFIIVRAEAGENAVPYFELVGPDSLVITPDYAEKHPEKFFVRYNPAIGELWIAVREPASGAWTIKIPPDSASSWVAAAKQEIKFQAFGGIPKPALEVLEPATDTTTSEEITIVWDGTSAEENATVSLFYSEAQDGAGFLIAEGLPIDGSYTWEVKGTPPGTYFICAVIDDGRNTPELSYAAGKVTVTKDPPQAQIVAPTSVVVGEMVQLDGSGTTDPWGGSLEFEWSFLSIPPGSGAVILSASDNMEKAYFVPDLPGQYTVGLTVSDPYGNKSTSQATIAVVAPPTALEVPLVGNVFYVGSEFSLVATVYGPSNFALAGSIVHFQIVSGPHAGLSSAVATDTGGKAAFAYIGQQQGMDTIRIWTGADTFEEAENDLRATVGVVWIQQGSGCTTMSANLSETGWHMMALPGELCPPCVYPLGDTGAACGDVVCALSDDLSPCFIFYWDTKNNSYVMAPPAENICYHQGMGFWVRTYQPNITVDADVIISAQDVTIPLKAGWNMIGNPFPFSVAASSLRVRKGGEEVPLLGAQAKGWVSAYLFGYDPSIPGYYMIDPQTGGLSSWQGYWIKAYVECELVVPAQPTPPAPPGQGVITQGLQRLGIELPPPPPTLPELSAELRVLPVPNPIRDVHTTRFQVFGVCPCSVQALRVEVYDLTGRLVWRGEVDGATLAWHTEGLDGLPLANGVYLYKAYVKVNGNWIPTGVQKVVILR